MRALVYDIVEKDGTKFTTAKYTEMCEARERGATCSERLQEVDERSEEQKEAARRHAKKIAEIYGIK